MSDGGRESGKVVRSQPPLIGLTVDQARLALQWAHLVNEDWSLAPDEIALFDRLSRFLRA